MKLGVLVIELEGGGDKSPGGGGGGGALGGQLGQLRFVVKY